jgi:hypothetical protein
MGLDPATLHFLCQGRSAGLSMSSVLTLGRQWLNLRPDELPGLLSRNGMEMSRTEADELFKKGGGYCEPLLQRLGAERVDSMDVSEYEHATILQDLNQPWPASLKNRFSLVVDAGTLEHVFHFPLALQNCMEAVTVGGHFLAITPANNLMGHGFYQFSPELYFRVMSAENGFQVERMLIYEQPWKSTWYEVADPHEVRSRVELVNHAPVYLIVCAKKVADVPVFRNAPLQSDYVQYYWQQPAGEGAAGLAGKKPPTGLKRFAPRWAGELYRKLRPFRPRYFRKVD